MSKRTVTEEFLSSLGLAEAKLSDKDRMSELSGEGSSFYAMDCEMDADSLESKKSFDMDNLRYPVTEDEKLRAKSPNSEPIAAKSKEDEEVLESA